MKKKIYCLAITLAMICSLVACGKEESDSTTTEATTVVTTEGTTEATTEDESTEGTTTEGTTETADTVTAQSVADSILNGGSFSEQLQPLSTEVALARLYSLDSASIAEAAFYTNSQATAEEIAVVKVNSADYIDTVKASFETRVADQKTACVDYLPDEMPKLDDAVIYVSGDYVVLCISCDSSKVESILADTLK